MCGLLAGLVAAAPPNGAKRHNGQSRPSRIRGAGTKADPSSLDPILKAALRNAPSVEQWPNENSIKLLDLANVTVKTDGTTIAQYRETTKLLNRNARNLAEVHLPYNASYQSLGVLHARTIQRDGTVLEVRPDEMRVGGIAGDYLLYDDAMSTEFSMPGIEEGCVIDILYEIVTRPNLMPGQSMEYWGFSSSSPVTLSRYVLHVPADRPLRYKTYNDPTLHPVVTSSLDRRTRTYTWERHDLPPVKQEPYMPPTHEVISWLEVSSIPSWQDVAHWFWDLQKPQGRATAAMQSVVKRLCANKKSDEEKTRAIYAWVAGQTRYVGLEFGISAYKPHDAPTVFHNLYGDCKDKANLLITLLGMAGIRAVPALLHQEDRRETSARLPTLSAFNHVIALARVSGQDVWLDATAETCGYGDLPAVDRGVQALVVSDGRGEFRTTPDYSALNNGLDAETVITLQPDGTAHAVTQASLAGELAQRLRAEIRALPPDRRKELAAKLAHNLGLKGKVTAFTLPNALENDADCPLRIETDLTAFARKAGHLLLMPLITALSGGARSNPFAAETRTWPIVNQDTSHLRSRTVLHLPAGVTVEDLPANLELKNGLQEYHRTLSRAADDKSFTLEERFVELPGRLPAAHYREVKGFWDDLIKSLDDPIVLRQL